MFFWQDKLLNGSDRAGRDRNRTVTSRLRLNVRNNITASRTVATDMKVGRNIRQLPRRFLAHIESRF
jgi:hypothetical protein